MSNTSPILQYFISIYNSYNLGAGSDPCVTHAYTDRTKEVSEKFLDRETSVKE